jgi:hypothetical protein
MVSLLLYFENTPLNFTSDFENFPAGVAVVDDEQLSAGCAGVVGHGIHLQIALDHSFQLFSNSWIR